MFRLEASCDFIAVWGIVPADLLLQMRVQNLSQVDLQEVSMLTCGTSGLAGVPANAGDPAKPIANASALAVFFFLL